MRAPAKRNGAPANAKPQRKAISKDRQRMVDQFERARQMAKKSMSVDEVNRMLGRAQ